MPIFMRIGPGVFAAQIAEITSCHFMSVPSCLLSLPTVKAFGCILPISTSNDGFSATGVQFFGGGGLLGL